MATAADNPLVVLIDEDLDVRLRYHFGSVGEVHTVEYRGWKGVKNGVLLQAIANAGDIAVFVTADQNLRHQQRVSDLPFGIIVLRSASKRLPRLLALMPEVLRVLPTVGPGMVVEVPSTLPGGAE